MKDVFKTVVWVVISILLILWTGYQSWKWFFENGQPFAGTSEVSTGPVEFVPIIKLETDLQPAQPVQKVSEVAMSVPTRYIQPNTEGAVMVPRCDTSLLNFYDENIRDYQQMFEIKPWLQTETDAGLRLQQLIQARQDNCY